MSGFTVSSLTNYARENADKIYTDAALGAQTLKEGLVTVQAGIKKTDKLMIFQSTAPFQADSSCGFNASGSSTFSDRSLTVAEIKVNDQWCPKDLQAKFTSTKLAAGAQGQQESLPFEQLIMDEWSKQIGTNLEYAIWQGDTSNAANTNLKQFDGFIKTIAAASPVAATTTADVTAGNVISIFNDVFDKIPSALFASDKEVIAMTGHGNFKLLVNALFTLNNYHYDVANAMKLGEVVMPATGLKVKYVKGLTDISGSTYYGKDVIIATYKENLVYGTDLANDFEDAKVWYSQDDDVMKASVRWKSGVQVARPAEIVYYTNA